MHIGFITSEYPLDQVKGGVGGIGTFTRNTALKLLALDHRVSVFVYDQPETRSFEAEGVVIHLIKRKSLKGFTWWMNRKHIQRYINSQIKKTNIDILEAGEWTGITAFMKFNVPLVLRLHGSDTYFCHLEGRKVKFKNKFFERKALNSCDGIVGVSAFVADKTKALFHIKKPIHVVHNGVDSVNFIPNHKVLESSVLLYFGTLVRKKGVLELAHIFNKVVEQYPEIKLRLIGKDNPDVLTGQSTLSMMKAILSDKGRNQLEYIPSVPYEKIQSEINKAGVVVLPSFAEAFPMTWLEAMALEKKVVTSNIGWANELMINGQTGYCVSPKNHEEYAQKIGMFLNEETATLTMGEAARKQIQTHFELKNLIKKNLEFYNEIIANN